MTRDLTEAQWWALRAFRERDVIQAAAALGAWMADRPGMRHGRGSQLRQSQGYGRLGARMARLLADKGLIEIGLARPHCMYAEYRITAKGREMLRRDAA